MKKRRTAVLRIISISKSASRYRRTLLH